MTSDIHHNETVVIKLPASDKMIKSGVVCDDDGRVDCRSVVGYRHSYGAVQWFECSSQTNADMWMRQLTSRDGDDSRSVWLMRRRMDIPRKDLMMYIMYRTAPVWSFYIAWISFVVVLAFFIHNILVACACGIVAFFLCIAITAVIGRHDLVVREERSPWIECDVDKWENILSLVRIQEIQNIDRASIIASIDDVLCKRSVAGGSSDQNRQ